MHAMETIQFTKDARPKTNDRDQYIL